jgi:NADH-quinone oxidoreductase subunit H
MNFFVVSLIKIVIVFGIFMTTLAYLQWIERKVLAHIQSRTGPLRVGPHGLMQPMSDVVKLLTKEDLLPPYVNRFFYLLAPFLAVCLALISISIIPFGPEIQIGNTRTFLQISDVNVGILFVLAISAVAVYGLALAGCSSNNKYSLMGGLRSSAQMISYELPLTLAIVAPLLLANHLSFREIGNSQAGYYLGFIPRWNPC